MEVDTVTGNKQTNMYVGRKRRKPVQKGVKPPPVEGVKSNPSKRHRERLNSELEHLSRLLPFPEDVISSLDKLSILRLSVSFLRNKSFFSAWKKQLSIGTNGSVHDHGETMSPPDGGRIPEGELLMQALNGFILVVTAEGIIFYCSNTIQDYLGFHQTDVMHQSVFDMIHTEDQQEFRRNLHWALDPLQGPGTNTETSADSSESVSANTHSLVSYNPDHLPPENSSFLERNLVCRFRCLLDNNSGFLALNIQGRLKFLHGQNHQHCNCKDNCAPPQLALFAIATPMQPFTILEIRTRNMIFRTKHKLDFTPMACDAKGKIVLGYTEAELRVRGSGYQFIHAADMLHCAENHVRMIKTGESGLTVFRLLTKDNRWKWVQANARLIFKNGKPDYIIATQRPLADDEGGEYLRKRSMHLPFTYATGEALLYQTGFPFPSQGSVKGNKSNKGKMDRSSRMDLDPKSLLKAFMNQDESVYVSQPNTQLEMLHQSSLTLQQPNEFIFNGSVESGPPVSSTGPGGHSSGTVNHDPLFESLSLDVDELCSNSELFNALENLGLDAEDLELLLLDERMVHLELDSVENLTNNNMLTYSHHANTGQTEQEEPGNAGSYGLLSPPPNPNNLASSVNLETTTVLSKSKVTENVVSQQVQHQTRACDQMISPVVQGNTFYHSGFMSTNDSPWVSKRAPQHHNTLLKVSQQNSYPQPLPSNQWQLHTDQNFTRLHPYHQESCSTTSTSQNYLGQATSIFYSPNESTQSTDVGCSISKSPYSCSTRTALDACFYQHQGQKNQQMNVQTHDVSFCLGPSSGVEFEQLLDLTHLQHNQTSLQPCSVFGVSAEDTTQRTLENNCPLSHTNASSIRSCLIPNGNTISISGPEGPAALQDPEKSGFH